MKRLGRTKTVVYVLLLGAAGSALLIDRAFSPAAAVAGQNAASSQNPARTLPDANDTTVTGPPLAAVFRTANTDSSDAEETPWAAVPSRDPFAISPKLKSLYRVRSQERQEAEAQRAAEVEAQRRQTIEAFIGSHRLAATMVSSQDAFAIIDGRLMRVGEQVDGFELRAIDHYRVHFVMDGCAVDLVLPDAPGSQVGAHESR